MYEARVELKGNGGIGQMFAQSYVTRAEAIAQAQRYTTSYAGKISRTVIVDLDTYEEEVLFDVMFS